MTFGNTVNKLLPKPNDVFVSVVVFLRFIFLIIVFLVVIKTGVALFWQMSSVRTQSYAVQEQLGLVPSSQTEGLFSSLKLPRRGDPFVGDWKTEDGRLFLRLKASGVYSGTYSINGVLGTVDLFSVGNTSLSGTLWLEGTTYSFGLSLNGDAGLITEVGDVLSVTDP